MAKQQKRSSKRSSKKVASPKKRKSVGRRPAKTDESLVTKSGRVRKDVVAKKGPAAVAAHRKAVSEAITKWWADRKTDKSQSAHA